MSWSLCSHKWRVQSERYARVTASPRHRHCSRVSTVVKGRVVVRISFCSAPPASLPHQAGTTLKYLVKCSFLEIYNEKVFDLLDCSPSSRGLSIREALHRGVYVDNLTEETVSTVEQAEGILRTGARNRRVGSTAMNRESSRSHSVFTIVLEAKDSADGITKSRCAR